VENNNSVNIEISVLDSYHMECRNYMFGALSEGGLVLQAKEYEKVIGQIVAVTECPLGKSREHVCQFFIKELFKIDHLLSSYTGSCKAVTIEMLSDKNYRIRISHDDGQNEVHYTRPLPTVKLRRNGALTDCFTFISTK
jgi:hypothetical protein